VRFCTDLFQTLRNKELTHNFHKQIFGTHEDVTQKLILKDGHLDLLEAYDLVKYDTV
jgi:hypothetical protein